MIDKIKALLSSGDDYNESDSEYDGFLSYAAEWHSLTLGIYDGMKDWRVRPKEMRDNDDVEKEPQYYAGGYVIGTLLQLLVAVVAAFLVV